MRRVQLRSPRPLKSSTRPRRSTHRRWSSHMCFPAMPPKRSSMRCGWHSGRQARPWQQSTSRCCGRSSLTRRCCPQRASCLKRQQLRLRRPGGSTTPCSEQCQHWQRAWTVRCPSCRASRPRSWRRLMRRGARIPLTAAKPKLTGMMPSSSLTMRTLVPFTRVCRTFAAWFLLYSLATAVMELMRKVGKGATATKQLGPPPQRPTASWRCSSCGCRRAYPATSATSSA
mmetsp:Transcript_9804/g.28041  ORF Transcript_9804/g.28041 Transcript_9804/m.28041 type:complete len:228 (-) Transcript_9804:7587-8270(-)